MNQDRRNQENALFRSPATSSTVLIVEDEPNMLDALVWLLAEEHYQVIGASSGDAALVLLEQQQQIPHALLLDYQLPGSLNGIELYDRLHARPGWQDVPAILMSANLPEEAVRTRHLTGLAKPFDINVLLAHIAAAVSGNAACLQV